MMTEHLARQPQSLPGVVETLSQPFTETPPKEPQVRDPRSKLQHLAVCRGDKALYKKSTGLERLEFVNQALPEITLKEIDLSTSLVGKPLRAPLMIAPMTGGNPRSHEINQVLACAAERWGLPMGVGSQRIALENSSLAPYFKIRATAPNVVLFANIGGAQLVKGWGETEARRAVEMIGADALFIHINAMQEAIQGGNLDFRGLKRRIQQVCAALHKDGIPVFVREVGFGISAQAAEQLVECGVAGIDCAGAGGTSWAKVEAQCAKSEIRQRMGQHFAEWGIPTGQSIQNVRQIAGTVPLIATGGLRNGVDLAKALALGADIGAMARGFLIKAHEGEEALEQFIENTLMELRICMFGIGAENLSALKGTPFLETNA